MRHIAGCRRRGATLLLILLLVTYTAAEDGVLVLVVTDVGQHPFANVRIGTAGDSGSPQFSDQNGKVRLKLASGTKPAAWVTLLVMGAPEGIDLAFISPYDGRVRVPPFDNEQENFDPVIVVKRGDRAMLETGEGMLALHATVNKTVATRKAKPKAPPQGRNAAPGGFRVPHLETVALHERSAAGPNDGDPEESGIAAAAEHFGLPPAELKAAIADWGGDPLVWKTILLTGTIETGGSDPFPFVRAFNNDVWFGVGEWSLQQCSLQPLLLKFQERDSDRFADIVGADATWLSVILSAPCEVSSKIVAEQMLTGADVLRPVWRERFRELGREPVFQRVMVQHMMQWMNQAQSLANAMGLSSTQSLAMVYDTLIQTGAGNMRRQQQKLSANVSTFQQQVGRAPDEQEKLMLLANQLVQWRQQAPFPQFAGSFVDRVHLFSQGTGTAFGHKYSLPEFGIGFQDAQSGEDITLHNDAAILAKLMDGWLPGKGDVAVPANLPFDTSAEGQFFTLVNQERAKHGVPPLQLNPQLTQAARGHTVQVAQFRTLSHQLPGEPTLAQRYVSLKIPTMLEGENVALGDSVRSAHRHLMDDPPHRDAILNPKFNAVGVGAVWNGSVLFVTQDFARVAQISSNEDAAQLVQQSFAGYAAQHGVTLPAPTPSPDLQQMVCNMAEKGAPDLQALIRLPGARSVMAWSTPDPARLNAGAAQTAAQGSGYSLATCSKLNPSGPSVLYWIAMVTY
jgi:uncharacterized protein YkwD